MTTTFIISDLHIPYQDESAMKVMMKMVHHFKPKNIIINGDALDAVQLSRFSRDPLPPESFKDNVEELCATISNMQKYSTIKYIQGNHEARLDRYVNDNAPELHGLITMSGLINDGLDTKIDYIKTVPSESYLLHNDDLMIGHFNRASKNTCYTVKALVERFQISVVQGHTHRLGEYAIRGHNQTLRGWEGGCLCDLDPDYTMIPNWMQGFLIYTRTNADWNIEIVHIDCGKTVFRGKVYK